jgi:hypothetical protein
MTEGIEYEQMPQEVRDIVDSWDDNKNLYAECLRIKLALHDLDWTCDYGLSGEVYDVKPNK